MAITNRDLDASQQKDSFSWAYSKNVHGKTTINTGATFLVCMFPYAGVLQSVRSYGVGLSGSPSLDFKILRFAAGGTSIACSISSMIVNEFGTSGILGYSGLAAAGSTLLLVAPGDILAVQTGVANTAADSLLVQVVIKKTQDVLSYNGVST
jgi:hypothetical protein